MFKDYTVVRPHKLGAPTRVPIEAVARSTYRWDADTMPIWWAYKRSQPTKRRERK